MANSQQQENMLLTEHFSWPPISLIDDIINAVNEVLYRCTDTFETGISGAPPHLLGFADRYAAEKRSPEKDEDGEDVFPDAALEIEEGVLKLETLMENAVDKNFDKLEIWTLRNVLCLPRGEEELANWVRLGHYSGLDTTKAAVDGKRWTPEKLYTLRRKLLETQKLHAALLAEKQRNAAHLAQLNALLHSAAPLKRESTTPDPAPPAASFAFLTHTPASQNLGIAPLSSAAPNTAPATPLTTHSSFTTSQLPYLRQLLANLRPHLASTALPSSAPADADDASRERKAYLESQSKRILERRGVDTKEGVEGAVEGGRVRAEEVRGLESIVEALGRGRGRGSAVVKDGEAMDTS
ncbi:Mis12 domain-containing protein [Boeremia exigua]|uniref:Mis12 domain-containing protein n=1 Tax=Boeremia exigua TaxID=749465 RepID=UPI001E8CC165|nr:Mis12 domain-containing protein [Boeremia exigua]KAH6644542.1 Mis12 domain-containing protein [Boeremia exigua]